MKPKRILALSFLLTPMLLSTSCANYNASPLCNPAPDLLHFTASQDGLTVISKAFTAEDCNRFLDRNVIEEGYQPVQIHIHNQSQNRYIFSLNRITLPVASHEAVAKTVHTSTVGRIVGYGAGALFLWPLAIPAIIDGIKSSEANDALDNDFAAKTAKDQIIFPHSHLNAIIFVPVHAYQNAFTLTLIDHESNQQKTFNLVSIR